MKQRKLASSYLVELYQDLTAMMGINAEEELLKLFESEMNTADGHKYMLKEKLKQAKLSRSVVSGFAKSHLETKINRIVYEIDHHRELFPEYYL